MIVKCLYVPAVIILCSIGFASNDPLTVYILGKIWMKQELNHKLHQLFTLNFLMNVNIICTFYSVMSAEWPSLC